MEDKARVKGDVGVPVQEATTEGAAVGITTAEWEGVRDPYCPWQEEVLDLVVSNISLRPGAGFDQEWERAAQRRATT